MRVFLPATVFLLAATALHATPYSPIKSIDAGVDPIVTGVRVTAEQKKKWASERAAYEQCPKCVTDQPFPEAD